MSPWFSIALNATLTKSAERTNILTTLVLGL